MDRQCQVCPDFVTSDHSAMKRHVAIVHGGEKVWTLRCEICQQKYYDFEHFQEHVRESPGCFQNCLMITPVPLKTHMENAFLSMVSQMMKPIMVDNASAPSASASDTEVIGPPKTNGTSTQAAEHAGQELITSVDSSANRGQIFENATANDGGDDKDDEVKILDIMESSETLPRAKQGMDAVENNDATPTNQERPQDPTEPVTLERMDGNVEDTVVDERSSPTEEASRTDQEQGRKLTKSGQLPPDLRSYFQKIVTRRHQDFRVICAVCDVSISAKAGKNLSYNYGLDHARCHLDIRPYKCQFCDYQGKCVADMHMHSSKVHKASAKYEDSTTEHLEEIKAQFAKCFDHDHPVVKGPKMTRRVFKRSTVIERSGQHKSISKSGRSSGGIQSNGSEKPKSGKATASTGTKSSGKRKYYQKSWANEVRKFIKDGKLQCQLCLKKIAVRKRGKNYLSLDGVYDHARGHSGVKPFKCCKCSYSTHSRNALYVHLQGCQKDGQRKFIDCRHAHNQKIHEKFLECFNLDGANQAAASSMDDGRNTATVSASSSKAGVGKEVDQKRRAADPGKKRFA